MIVSIALLVLLSFTTLIQSQLPSLPTVTPSSSSKLSLKLPFSSSRSLIFSLAYADKINIKNKSLINDISDQLAKQSSVISSKDELQSILQQIQTQIALRAGQDIATKAIKQIKSAIDLSPNGQLAQSLLFLAKQQAAGNIEGVNNVIAEVSGYAANGTDNIAVVLEQAVAATSTTATATQLQPKQEQPQPQLTNTTNTTKSIASISLPSQPSLQSLQPAPSASFSYYSNNNNNGDSNSSNNNAMSSLSSSPLPPIIPTLSTSPSLQSPVASSPNNALQQQQQQSQPLEQLPQTQQQQQIQQQGEQPQAVIPPSSYNNNNNNNISNTNTNTNNTNSVAQNSTPHGMIKVTSVDPPALSLSSSQSLSTLPSSSSSENDMPQIADSAGNYYYYPTASLRVYAGSSVTLNGGTSHDPNGSPITFRWEQISGPSVTLNGSNTSQATFTAPTVSSDTTMLFKLTVTNQNGLSDSKTVQITVSPLNNLN